MHYKHADLCFENGIDLTKTSTDLAYRELVNILLSELQIMRRAMEPFRFIVASSDGAIPTEKLALTDWHELTKACELVELKED